MQQAFALILQKASTLTAEQTFAKLEIALKETNETSKWLEMLLKSDYINEEIFHPLDKKCSTLRFLLVTSIKTVKSNMQK